MKTEELEDYWKSQDCIKPRKQELKEVYKTNNFNKRNKPIKNIVGMNLKKNILMLKKSLMRYLRIQLKM